jgi:hypothetical protein
VLQYRDWLTIYYYYTSFNSIFLDLLELELEARIYEHYIHNIPAVCHETRLQIYLTVLDPAISLCSMWYM